MFAVHEVTVEASFDVAVARLTHLINHGALDAPSEAAYEDGLAAVLRVGPFGSVRGLSKLVRVRFLAPVRRGGTLSVPLRWEATGTAGELFPVLDADLMVARAGDDRVGIALAGSYRAPFGQAWRRHRPGHHAHGRRRDDPVPAGRNRGRHRGPGA